MLKKLFFITTFFSIGAYDFETDLKSSFFYSMATGAVFEIAVEGLSNKGVPHHVRLRKRDKRLFFLLNTGYYAASGIGYQKLGEYRDLVLSNQAINTFFRTDLLLNAVDKNASNFPFFKYIVFSAVGYLTGALVSNLAIKGLKKIFSS